MADDDLSKLTIDKTTAAGRRSPKQPLRIRLIGVVVLALVAAILVRMFFFSTTEVEIMNVVQIYPSQSFTVLNASGYVVAGHKAAVASKVTGKLISLMVEEGSRIRKGDIIARLENDDVTAAKEASAENLNLSWANLDLSKAELQDATVNLDRSKELVSKGYISKVDHDTADTRQKKAKAGVAAAESSVRASGATLKGAEVAIEYTVIRAPFDAIVLTKNADIGDIISPLGAAANAQAAVVTIADMESLRVEVDVSESNIGNVKLGQPCEIQLDALPGLRFRGAVHMIVPTADRSKATVLVKVRFEEKDSRTLPEMSAKVAFLERAIKPEEMKPRTAINSDSLKTREGKTFVFLLRDGHAAEVPVTTGEKMGDMISVSSGINAGDKIIKKPTSKLRDGMKVKVLEK